MNWAPYTTELTDVTSVGSVSESPPHRVGYDVMNSQYIGDVYRSRRLLIWVLFIIFLVVHWNICELLLDSEMFLHFFHFLGVKYIAGISPQQIIFQEELHFVCGNPAILLSSVNTGWRYYNTSETVTECWRNFRLSVKYFSNDVADDNSVVSS